MTSLRDKLAHLDREELLALVERMVHREPELLALLDTPIPGRAVTIRKADIEAQVWQAMPKTSKPHVLRSKSAQLRYGLVVGCASVGGACGQERDETCRRQHAVHIAGATLQHDCTSSEGVEPGGNAWRPSPEHGAYQVLMLR